MTAFNKWGVLVSLFLMANIGNGRASSIDASDLLARSDRGRGGGAPGLIWDVLMRTSGSSMPQEDMRLRVKANDTASLAETLEPAKSKGSKMLQTGRTMWLSKPGLKKPIPISPRQRLSGLASIGDIAATNYNQDYQAEILRQDAFKGEPCYVLALTAREQKATYDKITYWISIDRGVGVYAEFLSLSGKTLKVAEFTYDNRLIVQEREIPFVSRMTISDALTDAKTTLEFGQVKVQPIPASEFDVTHLQ